MHERRENHICMVLSIQSLLKCFSRHQSLLSIHHELTEFDFNVISGDRQSGFFMRLQCNQLQFEIQPLYVVSLQRGLTFQKLGTVSSTSSSSQNPNARLSTFACPSQQVNNNLQKDTQTGYGYLAKGGGFAPTSYKYEFSGRTGRTNCRKLL